MIDKQYCVYIMASYRNGTLYIGSTSDLKGRVWEHKDKVNPKSFTAKYSIFKLVYYEECPDSLEMVATERSLKKWDRAWKLRLIEKDNPRWDDLSEGWFD